MIFLDEAGKVSATRAFTFLFAVCAVFLAVMEAGFGWIGSTEAWSTIRTVLVTLVGSIAVRSSVKHFADKGQEYEIHETVDGQTLIGYVTGLEEEEFPEEM